MNKSKVQSVVQYLKAIFKKAWQFKSNESSALDKDEVHYAKLGWKILLIGFGGFMLWALFAPLDKGVAVEGLVITDGQRKVVQPALSGVIQEILVKEGDKVSEGQLLLRMNDAHEQAQANSTKESISGLQAQTAGLEISVSQDQTQLSLINEQIKGMRELAREGYVAKNRVLELERTKAQLASKLAEGQGSLDQTRKKIAELNQRLGGYDFDLQNTTVESPVDGSVVNLTVFTVGQFIQAGTKVMEISPINQDLIVEGKVPVHLIDKVHPGLPVEMLFLAFNQRTTPHIPGEVTVVSADRTTDPKTGEPYYLIQAKVTDKGRKLLKDHQVRPGMPVSVFVVTGERTMFDYLLKPWLDRFHTAFNED